jgi:D-glycero-D-manno-heptose 1,7-bisphosphate phosphatase
VKKVTQPAVFLDRDGTLIEDVGYPTRPEQIRILGGVAPALARLAQAGYRLIVVTNQSGIARGLLTEEELNRFHQALDEQLELLGARLDAYYSCPHHPDPSQVNRPDLAVVCDCRKPRPGLILQAAEDLGLDLGASWTVGDSWRDVAAGQAAGTRTIKLPPPPGIDDPRPADVAPSTAEAADLDAAALFILEHQQAPPAPAAQTAPPQVEEPPAITPHLPEAGTGAPAPATEELPPPAPAPAPHLPEAVTGPGREAGEETPVGALSPGAPLLTQEAGAGAPSLTQEAGPGAPSLAPEAGTGASAQATEESPAAPPARPASDSRPPLLARALTLGTEPGPRPARGRDAAAPGPPEPTAALLREMLAELRRLERARHPPSLSLLRLLAYIVQAGAVACVVFALVGPDRTTFLLVAIILLLAGLTLLVLERRS